MKESKGINNKVVCAGCGCLVEIKNTLRAKKYGSPDYVYICSKCVHSGHEGFVYCNECYGLDDACWVNSDLLQHTVCANDEGQNMICPKIIELCYEEQCLIVSEEESTFEFEYEWLINDFQPASKFEDSNGNTIEVYVCYTQS